MEADMEVNPLNLTLLKCPSESTEAPRECDRAPRESPGRGSQ